MHVLRINRCTSVAALEEDVFVAENFCIGFVLMRFSYFLDGIEFLNSCPKRKRGELNKAWIKHPPNEFVKP